MAEKEKAPLKQKPVEDEKNDELEQELEGSFPASDPPSATQPNVAPGAPDHVKKPK